MTSLGILTTVNVYSNPPGAHCGPLSHWVFLGHVFVWYTRISLRAASSFPVRDGKAKALSRIRARSRFSREMEKGLGVAVFQVQMSM